MVNLIKCALILLVQTSVVLWVFADQECTDSTIGEVFEENTIIPDVVSEEPVVVVNLKFDSGVEVSCGNELTPTQVKHEPEVSYEADDSSYYTLLLTDPDNIKGTEWDHWLVGNIPGDDVSQGDILSQYISSAPSNGSGLHRYVITVFKQPSKLEFNEERLNNTSTYGRYGFSTKNFTQKYSLEGPVAGNFYRAQYDSYVDELYVILGVA